MAPDEIADEAVPEAGWVSPELVDEFPGLAIRYLTLEGGAGSSPQHVRRRLRDLSNRFSGAQAVHLRHQPIPWAYRVFYRHIGLDPDEQPTPVEELSLQRMMHGGFRSRNLLDDALAIAIMESGVALRAFDADSLHGRIGIRTSAPGETLAGTGSALQPGTLVIADEAAPVGLLFGATGVDHAVGSRTTHTALVAVQVRGVPDIAIEEAIWLAASVMRSKRDPGSAPRPSHRS